MRGEDDAIERWERWDAQERRRKTAHHRSRMRWWKHAREYLSLKRLVAGGLSQPATPVTDEEFSKTYGTVVREQGKPSDHPPWSPLGNVSNWYPYRRWNRQG